MATRRWRSIAMAAVLAAVLAAPVQAASVGSLKQYRVPTPTSSPLNITLGSDGNFWFTEGHVLPGGGDINHHVGRITPRGNITEFLVCPDGCFPNDIAQGPNGILYFSKSANALGRITTAGMVLSDIPFPDSGGSHQVDAHGDDIWFTDFNRDSLWRYAVSTEATTQFELPGVDDGRDPNPFDLAIEASGIVWFTESNTNAIGRLDPQTGVITETPVPGSPRHIAIAADGSVWFTEIFDHAVGRLDPTTGGVTIIQLAAGTFPEDIAAAPDGSVWVTQSRTGNIAQITTAGVIAESRIIRGSEPAGITVAPNGDPWFTELAANKIANLQLR